MSVYVPKEVGGRKKAVKLPESSIKTRHLCRLHLSTAGKMLKGNRPAVYSDDYLKGVVAALTWVVSENGTAEPPVRWSSAPFAPKKEVKQ